MDKKIIGSALKRIKPKSNNISIIK